jgi:hypothetical protein
MALRTGGKHVYSIISEKAFEEEEKMPWAYTPTVKTARQRRKLIRKYTACERGGNPI